MSTHSKLSPSSRHRWQLCPGSVREEAKYPEGKSSPASIDGTHSHTLLEWCIKEGWAAEAYIDQTMEDHEGSFVVDAARAERVQVALDYIDSRGGAVFAERRVGLEKLLGRSDLSGTVDVQIISDEMIEVIDYKDGVNPVEVQGNPQLEQYALGVISERMPKPHVVIRMTVIQPKLRVKGLPAISSYHSTVKELIEGAASRLVEEAAATDNPEAPLVPGNTQCKYCKAKGNCSALVNKTMESVGMFFKPIETAKVASVAQQSANKDPTTMSNDELVELLEAAPLMRQMLDAAEEEALNRAKAGQTIKGYKVVHGPGSRSWTAEGDEMAEKLIKMGVPKSAVYVTKLVSPAQAEKLVWEKKDGTKVVLSEKQLKRMETEYVVKNQGKLTLVPESDRRQSVAQSVTDLFSPVEQLPDWLK
jgi:hypothetical protein